MVHLPRAKPQPGKEYRPGVFTDTGKMHTTVEIKDEAGHILERHKYLIQSTRLTTIN